MGLIETHVNVIKMKVTLKMLQVPVEAVTPA